MRDEEPHYHGHRQRLRDRFLKSGLDGFADYEAIELLLTLAIPRSDVKQTQRNEGQNHLADSDRLAAFWRMRIGASANEVFEVGYLDSGYKLLRDGIERLEEGTIDRAAVYPRRVVEAALRRGLLS